MKKIEYQYHLLMLQPRSSKRIAKHSIDSKHGYNDGKGFQKSFQEDEFEYLDIVKAVILFGMPRDYLKTPCFYSRRNEIFYKLHILKVGLDFDKKGGCIKRNDKSLEFLDASELNVISYYIGMVFTYLIARKHYGQRFLVHLSLLKKLNICNITYSTGNCTPDLIGIKYVKNGDSSLIKKYSVFEAKGRNAYKSATLNKALEQVLAINTINSMKPEYAAAQIAYFSNGGELHCISVDPQSESETNITIYPVDIMVMHYEPLYRLFLEESKMQDGYGFYPVSIELERVNIRIKIKDKYKEFFRKIGDYYTQFLSNESKRSYRTESGLYKELDNMMSEIVCEDSEIYEISIMN